MVGGWQGTCACASSLERERIAQASETNNQDHSES